MPAKVTYIPDRISWKSALQRTTHLAIGAHPDDLELMAFHGIEACFKKTQEWFGGVTLCHGGQNRTEAGIRINEQKQAAQIGGYSFQIIYNQNSRQLRDSGREMAEEISGLIQGVQPKAVYTHSPFDRHPTHAGVAQMVLGALRRIPGARRPEFCVGCEVWGDLDWLPETWRVRLPVTRPQLADRLIRVYQSQIANGKRYDLAIRGRRQAHATFDQSHRSDKYDMLNFGLDLKPFMNSSLRKSAGLVKTVLESFEKEVQHRFNAGLQ